MNKICEFIRKASSYIFVALILSAVLFTSAPQSIVYAAESFEKKFEETNVLEDLEGGIINGETFDPEDYTETTGKDFEVLSLIEFGFTEIEVFQDDFGLYLYVYNTRGCSSANNTREKVQLSFGAEDNYNKYPLQLLNKSENFYKYKIVLSEDQRRALLNGLVDPRERIYKIGEIELLTFDNMSIEAFEVARTFSFSGHAKGYGSKDGDLQCSVNGLSVLKSDVYQTVYRPSGDFYLGTQSQLNSCFFRVPEKYFSKNELKEVFCEWDEQILRPVYVGENESIYKILDSLHGKAGINDLCPGFDFFVGAMSSNTETYVGFWDKTSITYFTNIAADRFDDSDYGFGFLWSNGVNFDREDGRLNQVSAAFHAPDGYENRIISSDELKEKIIQNSKLQGKTDVNGKYSSDLFVSDFEYWLQIYFKDLSIGSLFSSWSDIGAKEHSPGHHEKRVVWDDLFTIAWDTTTKSFWDKLFGSYTVDTQFTTLNAFVTSGDDDFYLDMAESDITVADRFKIGLSDVPAFRKEYELAKQNDERLVLMRFSSAKYYSYPCTESLIRSGMPDADQTVLKDFVYGVKDNDFDGYYAIEPVFLDFDIIQLTFDGQLGKVVIPVVISPQDVFSATTPPLVQDYHDSGCAAMNFIKIVAIVLLAVAVLFLVGRIIKVMNKAVNNLKPPDQNKRE